MHSKPKQLLSICVLVFFILLALGSNKMSYNNFNYERQVEDKTENRNYVELEDGTHVYGDKISWKSGLLTKDQIKIDGQTFKTSEVRGYREGTVYYGRLGNQYIRRIVHGKVNVYVQFSEVTTTTKDARGLTRESPVKHIRTDHYGQRGDKGPMMVLAGPKDMAKLVSDCPLAAQMLDISAVRMRKQIQKNKDFLNEIFDIYNNGCKPLR